MECDAQRVPAEVVRLLALLKGARVSEATSTGGFVGSQAGHGLNHEMTAFFNLFHDHVGSRIAHVRQCEQGFTQQFSVSRHVCDPGFDQIIEVARYKMAFKHLGKL